MPSDSGVTSRSSTSWMSPVNTPAWIAAPRCLFVEPLRDRRVQGLHARRAADGDDDVDVFRRPSGICRRTLARVARGLHEWLEEHFGIVAFHPHHEVARLPVAARREE